MNQAQDRRDARAWAQWMLMKPDLVILDTETTGLERAEVVEIAAINRTGSVLFHSLIKPYSAIPRDVMDIHGITNADVREARELPKVYKNLKFLFRNSHLVIYNANFDTKVLEYSAHCWNLPRFDIDAECAMHKFAQFYGDWSDYFGSYKWVKLVDAAYYCGVDEMSHAHTAIGDAQMTLGVLKGMAGWK